MELKNSTKRSKGTPYFDFFFGWIGPKLEVEPKFRWALFKDCTLLRFPLLGLVFNLWNPFKTYKLILSRVIYHLNGGIKERNYQFMRLSEKLEDDWMRERAQLIKNRKS